MRAGSKSTFVEIQRATKVRKPPTNALVEEFGKIGEAWVSFEPTRGTEDFIDGAREEQRVVRLPGDLLELGDVQASDRLVDVDNGGAILDVKANLPDRNGRGECVLECTQGPGAR